MAMGPAFKKAHDVAIANGIPSAILVTTTPGSLSTDSGAFAYEFVENGVHFNESMYDDDPVHLSELIRKNSKINFLFIEYRYYQLSLADPDKYYEEMVATLMGDMNKIRREVLIEWVSEVGNSPFDPEHTEALENARKTPIDTMRINGYYTFNIYKPLNPSIRYIVGVDVAKGKGKKADSTAITIVNARTGEIHAIFKSNVIKYKETYRILRTLWREVISNMVLVIENNIDTVIEYVMNDPHGMKNILYYEFGGDAAKEKRKKGILQPKQKSNLSYGLNTNTKTRTKYFDILFSMVSTTEGRSILSPEEIANEVLVLEYKTAERIEAASGKHDDVVLSYLLTQYVLQYGTNKQRFGLYNISALDIEQFDPKERQARTFREAQIFAPTPRGQKPKLTPHANPFYAELLDMEFESISDIEKRLANEKVNPRFMKGTDSSEMFTKSEFDDGFSSMKGGVFEKLNNVNGQRPRDNVDPFAEGGNFDAFAGYDYNSDAKDDDSSWF